MTEQQPNWHKSTFSGQNDNCVEVAGTASVVLVRDTKDHSKGLLATSPAAWSAFVGHAKDDKL
ncbi:DUF397 domain-containing protein [Streptomyces sp. NPDC098789]|uniref:DUF397 domain-containing protein n=1 Tax=Streptomyces sp. NPDC098789 TaxID=3366098 RepID=UPI0037F6B56F